MKAIAAAATVVALALGQAWAQAKVIHLPPQACGGGFTGACTVHPPVSETIYSATTRAGGVQPWQMYGRKGERYSLRIAYLGPAVREAGNQNALTVSFISRSTLRNSSPTFERDLTVCSGPTDKVLGSCRKMAVTSCMRGKGCKMKQVPIGQSLTGRLPFADLYVIEVVGEHLSVTRTGFRNVEQTGIAYRLDLRMR
jgi:hypothetical protein